MAESTTELGPYVTKALGEAQFAQIVLLARCEALSRELHVVKMENEALKNKKKPKAEVQS